MKFELSSLLEQISNFFSSIKVFKDFKLVGKIFDYQIGEYHLNLEILSKTQVKWEYISAPNDGTGKTGIETCTIQEISKGIYLFFWTEKDGSNVVDIFNLHTQEVFVNYTLPDTKMHNHRLTFKIISKINLTIPT